MSSHDPTTGAGVLADDDAILSVRDLKKYFPIRRGIVFKRKIGDVRAVDGVNFAVNPGETLGLVGESGCGKSTVARTLMRLHEPTSGHAFYDGRDLFGMNYRELRAARRDIQMIFQDPYTSLNPRMTVRDIIGEAWRIHPEALPKDQRSARTQELLELVGLNPNHVNRYPHQFSGGQRQRIGVARAIALNPKVVVCDEPVSALDVSVQAQVVNLLEDLQEEFGIAYVFIAHDLSVVHHISDRVAVMYLGRIVETGERDKIYSSPAHPYTQALLSASPVADPTHDISNRVTLEGDVPSPADPPSGCHFRTRCWRAEELCEREYPELRMRDGVDHPTACHFPTETKVELTTKG